MKWKRGMVVSQTNCGTRESATGYISGPFGIHKEVKETTPKRTRWHVTHLPTGLAMTPYPMLTLAACKGYVVEIASLTDWSVAEASVGNAVGPSVMVAYRKWKGGTLGWGL